ncbi:hypothetical protein GNQ08_08300 [Paenibacillus macerans]|uniref:Uncharacterized protein n=2 Tax=Paenibacillus macerans TaxID=44252 RepID=A0A6N8EUE6_PAEMA|nr:hypothetical protein [Paenibacillus macerans]MUG22413.1 hypothetical protein [Paenibacillus macerans]UMV49176.1 hypothetical protein LMZ02_07440 [Paenibacillus macerans]GBK65289.1 hypothetical protein PbDSM24746_52930 [Paenibacillus macerans]GBK71534.1 hypothetical protein PbJCM17693_52420 [Paenibacillus macerans]GIP09554.1 hypothetical protein J1TS5_17240 [Paenibacillus macerans]
MAPDREVFNSFVLSSSFFSVVTQMEEVVSNQTYDIPKRSFLSVGHSFLTLRFQKVLLQQLNSPEPLNARKRLQLLLVEVKRPFEVTVPRLEDPTT